MSSQTQSQDCGEDLWGQCPCPPQSSQNRDVASRYLVWRVPRLAWCAPCQHSIFTCAFPEISNAVAKAANDANVLRECDSCGPRFSFNMFSQICWDVVRLPFLKWNVARILLLFCFVSSDKVLKIEMYLFFYCGVMGFIWVLLPSKIPILF